MCLIKQSPSYHYSGLTWLLLVLITWKSKNSMLSIHSIQSITLSGLCFEFILLLKAYSAEWKLAFTDYISLSPDIIKTAWKTNYLHCCTLYPKSAPYCKRGGMIAQLVLTVKPGNLIFIVDVRVSFYHENQRQEPSNRKCGHLRGETPKRNAKSCDQCAEAFPVSQLNEKAADSLDKAFGRREEEEA